VAGNGQRRVWELPSLEIAENLAAGRELEKRPNRSIKGKLDSGKKTGSMNEGLKPTSFQAQKCNALKKDSCERRIQHHGGLKIKEEA